jgi:hypothetical protein
MILARHKVKGLFIHENTVNAVFYPLHRRTQIHRVYFKLSHPIGRFIDKIGRFVDFIWECRRRFAFLLSQMLIL